MNQMRQWMILLEVELPDAVFDAAAKATIDNVDWGGGGGETVIQMVRADDPYASPDDEEEEFDTDSPEFQEKLLAWAKDRVWSAHEEIDYMFQGKDVIRVYRMITAPPNWKPDPKQHPGIYWSWDEDAAEAHWGSFGKGHVQWLLVADVNSSQIDWVSTLAANAVPDSESEREITLRQDTPVQLVDYRRV